MLELLERLKNAIIGTGSELFGGLVDGVKGTFSEDGILSMKNIVDIGMLYAMGEALSTKGDASQQNIKDLKKEFNAFLPAYVNSKIEAGKMEQVALDDLNSLLNYGIVTERNEAGQITSRTKSPMGGSVDTEYEELYGIKPQYAADADGNIILDQQTGNPTTVRAGRPGRVDILGEVNREQQRLGDLAKTATRVDQLDQSGKAIAGGLRGFEHELSPEVQGTQKQIGDSFQSLLAAQDPSKLSGSEMANVERGLGRMGIGVGRTAEMDKYKAAMTFGDALAQKQQRLGQALGQSGSVVSSLKSGVNPGTVFGEGTMPTPTAPGQVTGFGTSPQETMSQLGSIIQTADPGKGGKERLGDVIFPKP
ncbi:hypothetical protein CMI37_17895 [Candidatus Pacearchaeota archaeon]|jgi:hypothetical protein|nr:hypothetical protein [Candidatus Pacearchaeota archaeon]